MCAIWVSRAKHRHKPDAGEDGEVQRRSPSKKTFAAPAKGYRRNSEIQDNSALAGENQSSAEKIKDRPTFPARNRALPKTWKKDEEARMGRRTGTIVDAQAVSDPDGKAMVGPELRRLRRLAGLTQEQIAARINVQQAAVSKIEKGGKIYLSTVQRYV